MDSEFEQTIISLIPAGLKHTKQAAENLLDRGISSYSDLIHAASSEADPDIQAAACELLGLGGSIWPSEESSIALRRALHSTSDFVRRQAIIALGKLGSAASLNDLVDIADSQKEDLPLRIAAIQSLESIRDMRAAAPLLKLAVDDTEADEIRVLCLEAIGHLQDKDSVLPILSLLESERVIIRFHAVFALGLLGDDRALPALVRILDQDVGELEDGKKIRHEARQAISNIKERRYY